MERVTAKGFEPLPVPNSVTLPFSTKKNSVTLPEQRSAKDHRPKLDPSCRYGGQWRKDEWREDKMECMEEEKHPIAAYDSSFFPLFLIFHDSNSFKKMASFKIFHESEFQR